jgi:hypothetical protein
MKRISSASNWNTVHSITFITNWYSLFDFHIPYVERIHASKCSDKRRNYFWWEITTQTIIVISRRSYSLISNIREFCLKVCIKHNKLANFITETIFSTQIKNNQLLNLTSLSSRVKSWICLWKIKWCPPISDHKIKGYCHI